MSIKVPSTIEKLSPNDPYPIVKAADVEGLVNTQNQVNTLQNTLASTTQTLQSDIAQKISGIHVEDIDNHAFDDINALHFVGATVSDDGGKQATVTIKPTIDISNGQTSGSTSENVKALEFPGSSISVRDPGGANIGVITIPTGQTGPGFSVLVDGSGFPSFKIMEFMDFTATLNGQTLELTAPTSPAGSGIHIDNGKSDLAGVTKLNFPTSEFLARSPTEVDITPYFKANELGEAPVLVENLEVMPPLQLDSSQGGLYQQRLLIDPAAYEPMGPPSFLGKASELRTLHAGSDTTIFYDEQITPYGMFFSENAALGGINIQEDDGRDPNLGGQLTELMASIGFTSKAPLKGNIKVWFMYHENGAYIPTGFVTGTDGRPLIVEKTFNIGDELEMLLVGAYYAEGQETITLHVEHSFSNEFIVIEPEKTLLSVNQFENGTGTALSRIEFQRRLGMQITPAIFKFDDQFAKMSRVLSGITIPEENVPANQGEEFLQQFGVNNLNACKASVQNDMLSIKDNGGILDFYIDYLVDNTRTAMMRGKQFTVKTALHNSHDAYNVQLFAWTGAKDKPSKIYSSRNNGALILNSGWSAAGSASFIPEDSTAGIKNYTATFTVPSTATNIAFAIYPTQPQSPINLLVHDFAIAPVTAYTGYVEIERTDLHEIHLDTSDEFSEYGQSSESYASLRYTLNYNPIDGLPMPVGELIKGNAPFTLDKSKNVISGSSATGGEGALVAGKDGQVSLSCDYLMWNEQNTDTVVDVWWVLYDVDGNESKIVDSQIQYTVPKNTTTHGILKTQPAFVFEVEQGQAFALRASANKADGAYLESTRPTDYLVRPVIDFKELKNPGQSDDPDLISSPIDKALTVDRRVYEFTGNTSQNITINVNIPADVELSNIEVVKHSGAVITSVRDAEYSYDSSTGILTVHVGPAVSQGRVYLEFWS